jgi:hypothetical protein
MASLVVNVKLTHDVQVHARFLVCCIAIPLVKVGPLAHKDFGLRGDDIANDLAIFGNQVSVDKRRNINLQIKCVQG